MKRNQYNISEGNLTVLKLIPKMMNNKKYRAVLRDLALKFILETGRK